MATQVNSYSVTTECSENRGMELTVNGEIIKGLRFNGGLTLIDADLKRTAGGTNNGHTAIGIPNYTINGNLEYDLPFLKGATVIGRVVNTGKQMVNVENTAHLPVWTRFDLAARYTFAAYGKPLTLRFGVDNLANTRFWSSAFNGYLLEGLPRTSSSRSPRISDPSLWPARRAGHT